MPRYGSSWPRERSRLGSPRLFETGSADPGALPVPCIGSRGQCSVPHQCHACFHLEVAAPRFFNRDPCPEHCSSFERSGRLVRLAHGISAFVAVERTIARQSDLPARARNGPSTTKERLLPVFLHRLRNLRFHCIEVEARTLLHGRIVDGCHGEFCHFLLNKDEAPELRSRLESLPSWREQYPQPPRVYRQTRGGLS